MFSRKPNTKSYKIECGVLKLAQMWCFLLEGPYHWNDTNPSDLRRHATIRCSDIHYPLEITFYHFLGKANGYQPGTWQHLEYNTSTYCLWKLLANSRYEKPVPLRSYKEKLFDKYIREIYDACTGLCLKKEFTLCSANIWVIKINTAVRVHIEYIKSKSTYWMCTKTLWCLEGHGGSWLLLNWYTALSSPNKQGKESQKNSNMLSIRTSYTLP